MNEVNRSEYWNKWQRFQQKYENIYEKKFAIAIKIQLNAFLKSGDVMAIPSYPIYEVMIKLYQNVGPSWAKVSSKMVKAGGQMGFSERIIELMRLYFQTDLLNDAELMTRYSREIISNVLSKGSREGWSYNKIVDELVKHPEFSRMRAMRIARTETVTAANAAAMIQAQNSSIKLDKIWISMKDRRTRHSHESVTKEPIAMNEGFQVGSAIMMQPGVRTQPSGLPVPASEIVNCRCTVAFIPRRNQYGRLVR